MMKSEIIMLRALQWLCIAKLKRMFPAGIPSPIQERFDKEWQLMLDYGKTEELYVFHTLAEEAARFGIPFNLRGPGNASLLVYLLNDSAVDPLPAFRYCRHCGHYEEIPDVMYGLDAPETDCPRCRWKMRASGFSLPLEAAWREEKGLNLSEFSTKLCESNVFAVLNKLYGKRVALMAEQIHDEHDRPKLTLGMTKHFAVFPEGKTLADYPDITVKCEQKKAVFAPLEELDRLGIRTMMFGRWRGYAIGDNPAQTLRGIMPMPLLIERLRDKVSVRSLIVPSEALYWNGGTKTRWAVQGMQSAPPSSYYELTETICRRHSSWISPYEMADGPAFSSRETLFNLLRGEGLEKDDATAVTRFIWKGRASEPKYRTEWLELLEKYPILEKYRKDAENCRYLWTQAAVLPAVMDAIVCAGRKTI